MDRAQGPGEVVREVLVELGILLGLDPALVTAPQRAHRVERLGRRIDLLAVDRQADGVGDEVGVALDERLDLPLLDQVLVFRHQIEGDRGARGLAVGGPERVVPLAVRAPAHGLLPLAAAEGVDRDRARDHEGGVETDTELPDQVRRAGAPALLQRVEEGLGARARDRAQVRLGLLGVHADAVVADPQCVVGLVGGDADLPRGRVGDDRLVRQPQVLGAVDGVGGVGDQLAQEDLLLGVERVDDEVEHLADLGLEGVLLGLHVHRLGFLGREIATAATVESGIRK